MSRKDYEAFAAMLAAQRESVSSEMLFTGNGANWAAAMGTLDSVTLEIAKLFAASNPSFSRERFLDTSGFNN